MFFFPDLELEEDGMSCEERGYWKAGLSEEYWDSGLTIQEYSELRKHPSLDPSVAKDLKMHRFSYCIRKRITPAVY